MSDGEIIGLTWAMGLSGWILGIMTMALIEGDRKRRNTRNEARRHFGLEEGR